MRDAGRDDGREGAREREGVPGSETYEKLVDIARPISVKCLQHRQAHPRCDRLSVSTQASCLGGLRSACGGRLAKDSCLLCDCVQRYVVVDVRVC